MIYKNKSFTNKNDVKKISYENIKHNSYIVFDIETTGLNKCYDEIIEIAAFKVKDNQVIDTFSKLIKPKWPITPFTTQLTGITNQMVKNADDNKTVIKEFFDFIKGYNVFVGHNIGAFDIPFINWNFYKNNLPIINNVCVIDTLHLSRKLFKNNVAHTLKDFCFANNVNYSNEKAHRATYDIEVNQLALKQTMFQNNATNLIEFLNFMQKQY